MSTSPPVDPPAFEVSAYRPLPKLHGLFVTGTDTGVGKTLISGAIARSLRHAGRCVEVLKPVATGCRHDRGQLVSSDTEFLAACADSRRPLDQITPLRFADAVAPNVAARQAGRTVDLECIFDSCRRLAEQTGPIPAARQAVVVEGAGGLLCPVSDEFWMIHLAMMLALPVVIVARAGLGTINHTLLTLHAARSAGLYVAGVVVNRYAVAGYDCQDPSVATNPAQIAARGGARVLAVVPEEADSSVEEARLGPAVQAAVDEVDWERVID